MLAPLRQRNLAVRWSETPYRGRPRRKYYLAGALDGWNITVVTQPRTLLDLNVLRLGLFSSSETHFLDCDQTVQTMQPFVDGAIEEYENY